jgi:hypothetical protein
MQDLRLVGVHDDGTHLLLSGAGGEMFQLPIDEALRTASRPAPRPAAERPAVPLSPRDIQARIRAGATAAEVAELSGLPLAKVERYEGPVLAEREYVAQQARKVEVASPSPGHDIYRSAFGDNPATLADMVAHRLSAHGIDAATVQWDSWRRQDGTWTVSASFEADTGGKAAIGEEPPALWTFSPTRKSLQNANRWAQQLSELEPLDGPVPARRLSAVSDRPFDFETDADSVRPSPGTENQSDSKEADGLLDMLRSRRGQRLGVDEDSDDALAVLLTHGVPAAHPRPSEVVPEAAADSDESQEDNPGTSAAQANSFTRRRDARPSMLSRLSLIPPHREAMEDALKLHDGVSTETREITIVASPQRPSGGSQGGVAESTPGAGVGDAGSNEAGGSAAGHASGGAGLNELLGNNPRRPAPRTDDSSPATGQLPETGAPERQPGRPKRSSVPSWDEIVFGTRSD